MIKTGERLNHLLDLIGFRIGRGRIPEFQNYLIENVSGMEHLKYSTVRSWFNEHSPPMKKVNLIINALHKEHKFSVDVDQIKVWWKLGGKSPFQEPASEISKETTDKLQFLIASIVKEESGENFTALSSAALINAKNRAIELAKDFANPEIVEVPLEYLRIFIADSLKKNSN